MCNTIPEDENGMPLDVNGPDKNPKSIWRVPNIAKKTVVDQDAFYRDNEPIPGTKGWVEYHRTDDCSKAWERLNAERLLSQPASAEHGPRVYFEEPMKQLITADMVAEYIVSNKPVGRWTIGYVPLTELLAERAKRVELENLYRSKSEQVIRFGVRDTEREAELTAEREKCLALEKKLEELRGQ